MFVVHQVVEGARCVGCDAARGEALVDGREGVGEANPYYAVEPCDGCVSEGC